MSAAPPLAMAAQLQRLALHASIASPAEQRA
jgi:hypothetical protein